MSAQGAPQGHWNFKWLVWCSLQLPDFRLVFSKSEPTICVLQTAHSDVFWKSWPRFPHPKWVLCTYKTQWCLPRVCWNYCVCTDQVWNWDRNLRQMCKNLQIVTSKICRKRKENISKKICVSTTVFHIPCNALRRKITASSRTAPNR